MSYAERVNRAIDYVVSHLDQPIRLQDLADAAAISPFHFHRIFQVLVGETPADFVKRLRLEKALVLMAHRRDRRGRPSSLSSIALDCGFSSSSDFSRCFKQRFGTSPSAFNLKAWREAHGEELQSLVDSHTHRSNSSTVGRLPPRCNPDDFRVRLRDLPTRHVAYIRVDNPYHGDGVLRANERLIEWAERRGIADNQWLGYQWDNPEITSLSDCRYYVAVETDPSLRPAPKGEVGRFTFPPMIVAQVEIRGGIDLELRALQWLYGVWLPRSGYVPDDHPGFEAWIGRPFAHGVEHFEINIQLPVRTARSVS